jgi:hypothetical protein
MLRENAVRAKAAKDRVFQKGLFGKEQSYFQIVVEKGKA